MKFVCLPKNMNEKKRMKFIYKGKHFGQKTQMRKKKKAGCRGRGGGGGGGEKLILEWKKIGKKK
jgi:hypothetical protein